MVSKSQHWLHQFQLLTEHSLKGATNYGNRATGVGTKHAVLRPRPRPGSSGLETKTETLDFRSWDQDRDLDKMNSSALETRDHGLESRDHGLEITTLPQSGIVFLITFDTWPLVLTHSATHWKRSCSRDTSTFSKLGVWSTLMCSINSHITLHSLNQNVWWIAQLVMLLSFHGHGRYNYRTVILCRDNSRFWSCGVL